MKHTLVSSLGPINLSLSAGHTCLTALSEVSSAASQKIAEALDAPIEYPPFEQSVVPGDLVAIAIDASIPEWSAIVGALVARLEKAGVKPATIEVVATQPLTDEQIKQLPAGVAHSTHAPRDRNQLAYLASSRSGRRVYLNRRIVDADVVIGIGPIAPDPAFDMRGPASVIFPSLSDLPRTFSEAPGDESPFEQIMEIGWLLGAAFQIAVVPGESGLDSVFAGAPEPVHRAAEARHRAIWSVAQDARSDLVIAAIGAPSSGATWDQLAVGLKTALSAVKPNGQIVLCARFDEPPGPALQRVAGLEDPAAADRVLADAKAEPDYEAARALAAALAHARVGLLGTWTEQVANDLGIQRLDDTTQLQRLLDKSSKALLLSRADQLHLQVSDTD